MKDTEKMDGLRTEYMTTLAEIAGLAVDRASHIPSDMGMNALRSPEEAAESLKLVEKINRRIADTCNKLRAIEQRAKGGIGIPAVFETDVPNCIRVAVAIFAGRAISGSWGHETRYVGNLLQPAGGDSPQDLLTVRESFRKTGLLRQHIHCEPGRTIDEMGNLTLSETSFRKLLALEPDSECDELFNARSMVALLGRR